MLLPARYVDWPLYNLARVTHHRLQSRRPSALYLRQGRVSMFTSCFHLITFAEASVSVDCTIIQHHWLTYVHGLCMLGPQPSRTGWGRQRLRLRRRLHHTVLRGRVLTRRRLLRYANFTADNTEFHHKNQSWVQLTNLVILCNSGLNWRPDNIAAPEQWDCRHYSENPERCQGKEAAGWCNSKPQMFVMRRITSDIFCNNYRLWICCPTWCLLCASTKQHSTLRARATRNLLHVQSTPQLKWWHSTGSHMVWYKLASLLCLHDISTASYCAKQCWHLLNFP